MDAARVREPEALEAGLDALIERRARDNKADREREESWKESVRAYHAEHREALRYQWITYYRRLARNHALLSEANAVRAADLAKLGEALNPGEGVR